MPKISEERKAERREQILDVTREIVDEHGEPAAPFHHPRRAERALGGQDVNQLVVGPCRRPIPFVLPVRGRALALDALVALRERDRERHPTRN